MDNRRIEVLQIRLSKTEKDLIKRLAEEKDLNISDFLRYCLLQEISKAEDKKIGK